MGGRLAVRTQKLPQEQGFTLVEVLVALAIIPLVLGITFSTASVALRASRLIDARAVLSSAGMLVMETLGQDLRGIRAIYSDGSHESSDMQMYGRLQDGTDVAYEFTPPEGSQPGTLRRNGRSLLGSGISVTDCSFTYLDPGPDPDRPFDECEYREVPPQRARSVRVRIVLRRGSTSVTFESVFDLRNL